MSKLNTSWSSDQRSKAIREGKTLVMIAYDDYSASPGNLGGMCSTRVMGHKEAKELLNLLTRWKKRQEKASKPPAPRSET